MSEHKHQSPVACDDCGDVHTPEQAAAREAQENTPEPPRCLAEECYALLKDTQLFCTSHNTPANRKLLREVIGSMAEDIEEMDDLEACHKIIHDRVLYLETELIKAINLLSTKDHRKAHTNLLAALQKD